MKFLAANDVIIRPFQIEDVLPLVEYMTDSSEEYWRKRGVDKSKLRSREESIANYLEEFASNGEVSKIATILLNMKAVGIHNLSELQVGDSAVFHAHIWKPENRRRGICTYSYLKAADYFFDKFRLKKLIYKTPKLNLAPNRLKEKIGIPLVGETIFDWPTLLSPLPANVYELDPKLLEQLKAKHGI